MVAANRIQHNFKTTKDISVSSSIVDHIIGQEEAVDIIKKAAKQRRNVLLIGEPGTGKSLTGQALAELIPKEDLDDIISFENASDDHSPLIKVLQKGEGIKTLNRLRIESLKQFKGQTIFFYALILISMISPWWVRQKYGDIMAAATLISSMIFIAMFIVFINLNKRMAKGSKLPKLLIDNSKKEKAPFIDATGSHAGALLGDVLHDPLQSFFVSSKLQQIKELSNNKNIQLQIQESDIQTLVNNTIEKHKNKVIKKDNYDATFLDKGELQVLGEKEKNIYPVEVLSTNRYPRNGNLIKLTTASGKELIVTPEHKIAVKSVRKIKYKRADKLTRFDKVVSLDLS